MEAELSLDPVTAGIDLVTSVINKFSSGNDKANALMELKKLEQTGELAVLVAGTDIAKAQLGINAEEAKSPNLFVAGWRPFFGWMCGAVFLYHYLLQPLIAFTAGALGHPIPLPQFDMGAMADVTWGILGLGGMRSFEKLKGLTSGGGK